MLYPLSYEGIPPIVGNLKGFPAEGSGLYEASTPAASTATNPRCSFAGAR